jgi:3-oxoacyl-(acyl-carrier-protein) synthase
MSFSPESNFYIQGIGAISPLGPDAEGTWKALCEGKQAPRIQFANPVSDRNYYYCPVPKTFLSETANQRRLRRSGTVSLNGAAAAFNAIHDAGIKEGLGRTLAVIFAICSGGVNYTRRLYHEIVTEGAAAASPLLFPETVFNAPASHMAAMVNCDEHTYTLVGDSSVGLSAVQFAVELLTVNPSLEHCLLVGAEEGDWLLADAFNSWRYASTHENFEVYGRETGTLFGEGGSAVVIGRHGAIRLANHGPGASFFSKMDAFRVARGAIIPVIQSFQPEVILGSANGTFTDKVEHAVFTEAGVNCPVYCHKPALGEALGASALQQIVFACLMLKNAQIPPTLSAGSLLPTVNTEMRSMPMRRALVTTIGFNQQVNTVALERVCDKPH